MRSIGFRCAAVYLILVIALVLAQRPTTGVSLWGFYLYFALMPSIKLAEQFSAAVPQWLWISIVCATNAVLLWLVVEGLVRWMKLLRQPDDGSLGLLRAFGLVAAVIGATGSVGLMFRASQHPPRSLLVLFTIWVLGPFVALLRAIIVSKRWLVATRATLYGTTLIVTLGSLAIYGELIDVKPAGSANAFLWVIVPPVSGAFAAIVDSTAAFISRQRSARGLR